jgi:hypothetical protein
MSDIYVHMSDVTAIQSLYEEWARDAQAGASSFTMLTMAGPMPDGRCFLPRVPDDFLPVLESAGVEFARQ